MRDALNMSQKSAEWREKSVTEKAEAVIERAHAAPMGCLNCGARLMPSDLAKHRSRCERPVPQPNDAWESERDTVNRGVTHAEINRLVLASALRVRERDGGREFLLRDVETFLDARRLYGSALSIAAT